MAIFAAFDHPGPRALSDGSLVRLLSEAVRMKQLFQVLPALGMLVECGGWLRSRDSVHLSA